jgi:hypothetical protein
MIKYIFNDEKPLTIKHAKDADPQAIGDALTVISNEGGGRLTPKAVLHAAKDPTHVLHRHFEWDDAAAAEHYRQGQARALIRCVQIVNDDEKQTPAFLSITDKAGVSYRPLQVIMASAELQLAVLQRAERDLEGFERRYRDLGDICDLVREAREKAAERRTNLENRAAAAA